MLRDPELLSNPQRIMSAARSAIVFALQYPAVRRGPCPPGFGQISRYAAVPDYHQVLGARLEQFLDLIKREIGPFEARAFTDAVPLLERALAERAGLGFAGKNSMLIRAGIGSFFFLGEVLTGFKFAETAAPLPQTGRCGSCERCLKGCPTNAFSEPYVLNAAKCISYLTIEKRGALTFVEREAVGSWLFGCDICQEVCPFNHAALGKSDSGGAGLLVDLKMVLEIRDDAAFKKRFAASPFLRAKREGLLRNAAVVAANTNALNLYRTLMQTAIQDVSPVVRQHALWALWKMRSFFDGRERREFAALLAKSLADGDSEVRAEARTLAFAQ